MSRQSIYKKQKRLSTIQFFTELPDFLLLLASAILSRSLLVFVDLFDSLSELLKSGVTAMLSKKLSRDLRFEYNYGVGKIEAISALLCDGIIILGVILTVLFSVRELIFPSKPSDFLIYVVFLKVIHVSMDTFFLIKQHRIKKKHFSPLVRTSFDSAIGSLLFDSVTLVSLLTIWLFRENPFSGYISPIITILIAAYLLASCIIRNKRAVAEITDKTLPEDDQLKILSVVNRFNSRYSLLHDVKSRKSADMLIIDLHLSFSSSTTFAEITSLGEDMQNKMNELFDDCTVNIVIQQNSKDQ